MTEGTTAFPPLGRRRFLLSAGGFLAAAVLGACGDDEAAPRPQDVPVTTDPNRLDADLQVAALLVSLENLLVTVYQEVLDRRDRLGEIPAVTINLLESAQRQHRSHAGVWNSILTGAGKPGVSGVNLTVRRETADPGLVQMADASDVLSLGYELETLTAASYLGVIGTIQNNAVLKTAVSIQAVENEHAAVIAFLMGRPLDPAPLVTAENARPVTDSIG